MKESRDAERRRKGDGKDDEQRFSRRKDAKRGLASINRLVSVL